MTWLLEKILCAITALIAGFVWAIITVLNLIIVGLGDLVTYAVAHLPNMPDGPEWSGVTEDVFGYSAWVFPVGFLVTTILSIGALWLAWQLVAILFRWAKATS